MAGSSQHVRVGAIAVALALSWPAVAAGKSSGAPIKPAAPVAVPATLALLDAQNIALAASPQLELARAAVDQAQAAAGLAFSSAVPQVSASGGVFETKSGGGGGGLTGTGTIGGGTSVGGFSRGAGSLTSASLNLRQLIFDGGRVRSQIVAASLSADAARLQLRRQVQTVLFSVAQQYYAALQARHQLDVANDSRKQAQVQLDLVQAQFSAGVAAQADVQTARLPVAQADLAVAQAANGERIALATLLDTMGVSPDQPVTLQDETGSGGGIPSVEAALQTAAAARADLLAAVAAAQSAAAGVRAARAARIPALAATASDGVTNFAGSGYSNNYSYGVSLSFPIFDGGSIRAQTAAAQAQARSAQANLRTAQLAVALSVRQAWLALETARAGLTAADAELAQAHTVLAVTNAQYRAGVTTLPLLLNAQTGYAKAQSDRVNAVYAYKIAQQQLLFAEGTVGS